MQKQIKIILLGLWMIVGISVGGVAAAVWWYRQRQPAIVGSPMVSTDTQPVLHHLDPMFDAPAFSLTDQDNHAFTNQQLRGKVWVADFIFTSCTSFCPLMTQQMLQFQKQTIGSDIHMVSFSVDPETDTPAVFKTYAETNGSDQSRWHFLTGDKDACWKVSNAMKLAVGPGDNKQTMHSSHFLLVDKIGRVRGVYDYKDAGFLARLVGDAKALENEK